MKLPLGQDSDASADDLRCSLRALKPRVGFMVTEGPVAHVLVRLHMGTTEQAQALTTWLAARAPAAVTARGLTRVLTRQHIQAPGLHPTPDGKVELCAIELNGARTLERNLGCPPPDDAGSGDQPDVGECGRALRTALCAALNADICAPGCRPRPGLVSAGTMTLAAADHVLDILERADQEDR